MTLLSWPMNAYAQQQNARLSPEQIGALIAQQRAEISIDEDGCLKNPDDRDAIVVCGEDEEAKRQKLPIKEVVPSGHCKGGFIECGNRNRPPIPGATPFGYVKPMAYDWEKFKKGLPEPEMVVKEGEAAGPPPQ
jgi:hypothetical protein